MYEFPNLTVSIPPGLSIKDFLAYGYVPSRAAAIVFLAIFSKSFDSHVVQVIITRKWFMLTAVAAAALETIGWAARLWSSWNAVYIVPYVIQSSTTVLAPTPLLATLFLIVERIITILGPQYSRLSPKFYTRLFVSLDVISLNIQGVGVGVAASAAASRSAKRADIGSQITLSGIIFQVVSIAVFCAFLGEFLARYIRDNPLDRHRSYNFRRGMFTKNIKAMVCTVIFCTICLFIRAIYRTLELSEGWKGTLKSNEILFVTLDGMMVAMALCALNFAHPARLLFPPSDYTPSEIEMQLQDTRKRNEQVPM